MKARTLNLIWGLLLIAAGGLFLAQNLGLISAPAPLVWAGLFGVASLTFFASYFVSGARNWGWLFPAFVTGAVAATIFLAEMGISGAFMASMILWSVAVPFLVPFVQAPRENWWALIPAYVLGVIGGFLLLSGFIAGEWLVALVMFTIALPFFVAFLLDQENWWALIPGFVMAAVGLFMLLITQFSGEALGAFVLLAIALPFFVVFLRTRDNWWALIPAGVLATIAVVVLAAGATSESAEARWLGGVMFLGLAATFGTLWLMRSSQPTEWAKYPAAGLLVASLAAFAWGAGVQIVWPLALILIGGWLIIDVWRRGQSEHPLR